MSELSQPQVPSEKFVNNLTVSVLRYTPTTAQDYSVLNCWARNSQGQVEEACKYANTSIPDLDFQKSPCTMRQT